MTIELLRIVRRVAMNFRNVSVGPDIVEEEPPLHAFIGFLTFEKRQRADPVFTQWIKQHYTRKSYIPLPSYITISQPANPHYNIAQDVLDLYTDQTGKVNPGFTVVADNLPGVMQYLDLVRDCIEIFDLLRLPPNDVQNAHSFDGTMGRSFKYAAADDEWNREYRVTSKPVGSASDSDDDGDDDLEDEGGEDEEP